MATAGTTTDRGDAIITDRIENARRALWRSELASALLVFAIAIVALMIGWAILDQWFLKAGRFVRLCVWIASVVAAGAWVAIRIIPLIRNRIHPEYEAQRLERRVPEFRHSLLSYLTLRNDREVSGLRGVVVRSIASHAARRLADPQCETLARENRVAWLAIVLASLAAIGTVYAFGSPKDTKQSVKRLLMPLASIDAPTSVRIEDVMPGEAEVVEGTRLEVSAEIYGLADDQEAYVEVVEGTVSSQLSMRPERDSSRFVASVGNEANGIRHPLRYTIIAGDARKGPFEVSVQRVPVVSIRSVAYQPAAYTRLQPRVTQRGAIHGLEGTRVSIVAQSNLPLAKAKIEYNPKQLAQQWQAAGGVKAMELTDDGRTLTTSLTLRQPSDEVGVVAVESYRIVVEDEHGNTNPSSVVYPVHVSADLAPEVSIIVPQRSPKDLPIEMEQLVEVHALDPDFGLSRMEFELRKGKRVLGVREIFKSDQPLIGQQISISAFRPRDWNLIPGDTVTLRCRAFDNRDMPGNEIPDPNTTLSDAVEFRIVAVQDDEPPEDDGDGMQSSSPDDTTRQSDGGGEDGQSGSGGSGSEGAAADGTPQGKGEPGGSGSEGAEQGEQTGEEGDSGGQGGKPSQDKPNDPAKTGNQGSENAGTDGDSSPSSDAGADGGAGQENSTDDSSGKPDDRAANKGQGNSGGKAESGEMTDSSEAPDGSPPTGAGADSDTGDSEAKDGSQGSSSSPDSGDPSDSGASQDEGPLHDGEIIERVREHMKQTGQDSGKQGGSAEEPAAGDPNSGGPDSGDQGTEASKTEGDESGKPPGGDGSSQDPAAEGTNKPSEHDGENPNDGSAKSNPSDSLSKPDSGGQGSAADDPQDGGGSKPNDRSDGDPSGSQSDEPAADDGTGDGQDSSNQKDDGKQPSADGGEDGTKPSGSEGDAQRGKSNAADGEGKPNSSEGDATESTASEDGSSSSETDATGDSSSDQATNDSPGSGRKPSPQNDGDRAPSDTQSDPSGVPQGEGRGEGTGGDETLVPEEVNKEYAEKATDLVLDYLKNQQDEPDSQLLDKLNWTEEDMQRFVDRWQRAREIGRSGDAEAQQAYLEQLESLGIRPNDGASIRGSAGRKDNQQGNRDSGSRTQAPPLYREAFEAFRQSISRPDGRR